MSSKTTICNMALSHVGVGKQISDVDTEESEEARACLAYYDSALKATLRDHYWPFANKIAALAVVEEEPNEEWLFSYTYPSDCVSLRRIQSGVRNDTREARAPFRIMNDSGPKIFCDIEDAIAEYTMHVTNVGTYPPDFILAFSVRLAIYLVPRLSRGDPFKMRRELAAQYQHELGLAIGNSANEEQADEEPDNELTASRS